MKIVNKNGFTKIYRMAGNGYTLWFKNYNDANEYARTAYKNKGKGPWYGRANRFWINFETGEIK
jgi:hypothetical protein